jgi:hypothetical protein
MTANTRKNFETVFECLVENGFLLLSGTEIPNVRGLISMGSSKGSWWADPAAHEIFAVNGLLEDHPDVTVTRLISGKVTFVHRKLWDKLFAVGNAREQWQLKTLSTPAQSLLQEVDKVGTLLTNKMKRSFGSKPGDIARELELRLLIHAEQFHTESGAHAKLLETWESWAKRVAFKPRKLSPSRARHAFEKQLDKINKQYSGRGRLPWPSKLP